jgi:hypothetical protein
VLVVMCVGYFLVLLDATIVNVALPQIGKGVGAIGSWAVIRQSRPARARRGGALRGRRRGRLALLPGGRYWR